MTFVDGAKVAETGPPSIDEHKRKLAEIDQMLGIGEAGETTDDIDALLGIKENRR